MADTVEPRLAGYLRSIRKECPRLAAGKAELLPGGLNSDLLLIGDTWIFRFPRHDPSVLQLPVELAVLRALHGRLPLAVPEPVCARVEPAQPGVAFIGYHIIPGVPLTREALERLDGATQDRIAAQLTAFLHAFHATPHASVGVELPVVTSEVRVREMLRRVQSRLFPRMRADARGPLIAHFAAFLAGAQRDAWTPVLLHGDLFPANILHDAGRHDLTGVVDFGGAGLGDPAYDLAALLSGYGEPFAARLIQAAPRLAEQLPRARFYAGTFALEAALYGLDTGDLAMFREGMAAYL